MTKDDFQRFRTISNVVEQGGRVDITVETRMGGGNRTCYCGDDDLYPNGETCSACQMEKVTSNDFYIEDRDDSYDETYAYYVFAVRKDKFLEYISERTRS